MNLNKGKKNLNKVILNFLSVYLLNFIGKYVLFLLLYWLWLIDFKFMYYILILCLFEFILIFFFLVLSKLGCFIELKNVRVNMFLGSNFFLVFK